MVVPKAISGTSSVFHNLATVVPLASPAFICYARACTSTQLPIAISMAICTLVNTNNVCGQVLNYIMLEQKQGSRKVFSKPEITACN